MREIYQVSDVVHYLKNKIEADYALSSILVQGEVSNFTNHRSGHWYFTLKDKKARISCVMFASYASRTKFVLKEGMKVIVAGSLGVYESSGSIQLYVNKVVLDGVGELFLKLEECKKRLAKQGYFAIEHKKSLPTYPSSIAIICGKDSDACSDVLKILTTRWPVANIQIYHALVQGNKASNDIIRALQLADDNHHDIILLVRGGGSIEDLWCFNDEQLAIAIYNCHTPIVTGVGHENDTTLVDYVSDVRALTPTGAASMATPDIKEVKQMINNYQKVMVISMQYKLKQAQNELMIIKKHRYIAHPLDYVKDMRMSLAIFQQHLFNQVQSVNERINQLKLLQNRLITISKKQKMMHVYEINNQRINLINAIKRYDNKQLQKYQNIIALLDAYSPLKSLSRGYSITYVDKHIIKSIDEVNIEDRIKIRMKDGWINATCEDKEKIDG